MKKALIVLDVQDDFLRNTLDYIAPLCQQYLDEHGGEYDAIVLTRWIYDEMPDEETLLVSHPKAVVVKKSTYSAYTEDTRKVLADKQIEEVHITGVDTEGAVLATMFSMLDAGFQVKILERLVTSYHGRNWEAMTIARHILGAENVLNIGGGNVYV
ncbi:cysteine hydrolase family protein [Alicyclobacillus tolerans]|uniref:cysteine hydrolase family protein n=1 Tax=Alicyclobacillus tolerans TaxID=90970 RepID=UPI001F4287C6|nr:cysteine hydrolase family protein [Alicyclobacillus tolerans]MCF8564505.1 cysteine hydrolase family protein [Alicyclobacillus tolerans]